MENHTVTFEKSEQTDAQELDSRYLYLTIGQSSVMFFKSILEFKNHIDYYHQKTHHNIVQAVYEGYEESIFKRILM